MGHFWAPKVERAHPRPGRKDFCQFVGGVEDKSDVAEAPVNQSDSAAGKARLAGRQNGFHANDSVAINAA